MTNINKQLSSNEVYQALQKSEARYRELVDNANSIILHWDHYGIITYFNEFAQKFFGYTEDEIIGQHVMDTIVPPSESTGRDLKPLMDDICNNPENYQYNVNENITKNGDRVWVAWTNKVFTDENGNPTGALSIGSDITKQRQLEEELNQAKKMEALGQLAGGISHDFNNMLHGIIGYSELIKESTNDEELKTYANKIISTSGHAADLIKQLLAFSRRGKYQIKQCNIYTVLDDVASILHHTINKKIKLISKPHSGTIFISGDAAQLHSAFINIGINANDAMPDGGELIFKTEILNRDAIGQIDSNKYLNAKRYIKISITDSGTGIDEETLQHIFEPFFTTKPIGQGTGMGLAAVYGTVINHDGDIQCYSTLGKGTCFEILLPISDYAYAHPDKVNVTIKKAKKYSIMLVDDEAIVRTYTKKLFELKGHKVTTFSSPKTALESYCIYWNEFDLIILDMSMPEMTGKELFNKMKIINPGSHSCYRL